jgi:hypothetical protein
MISGKLNLSMLHHVITEKNSGKTPGKKIKCIIIPIEENDLYLSDKGNVFLDIIAFDSVKEDYQQTHTVKQSFKEGKYTKEERFEKPFLGNLNANMGGGGEPKPNSPASGTTDENDDLPF